VKRGESQHLKGELMEDTTSIQLARNPQQTRLGSQEGTPRTPVDVVLFPHIEHRLALALHLS